MIRGGAVLEEKEDWMVELWQPLLDQILKIHQEFTTGKSKCNVVLLTTERNFFSEFEKHFIEPAFKEISRADEISGYYFEKHIDEFKEVIFLGSMAADWFSRNVKSLGKFFETAKLHKKFIVLCAYDYSVPKFHRSLRMAFGGATPPEIKELGLKSPD